MGGRRRRKRRAICIQIKICVTYKQGGYKQIAQAGKVVGKVRVVLEKSTRQSRARLGFPEAKVLPPERGSCRTAQNSPWGGRQQHKERGSHAAICALGARIVGKARRQPSLSRVPRSGVYVCAFKEALCVRTGACSHAFLCLGAKTTVPLSALHLTRGRFVPKLLEAEVGGLHLPSDRRWLKWFP